MDIRIFAPSVAGPLRQGEIISGFTQTQADVGKLREGVVELIPIKHPYVIVLSQDCDLEQDYLRRAKGETEHLLSSVLLCAAAPADEFRGTMSLRSKEWKRVEQNNDSRYHFLREMRPPEDAAGGGVPALAIDFKQHFALPVADAYYWLESSVRHGRLESPYREHLSARFASYLCRVALPLDHHQRCPLGMGNNRSAGAQTEGPGRGLLPSRYMTASHPVPVGN